MYQTDAATGGATPKTTKPPILFKTLDPSESSKPPPPQGSG